MSMMGAWLDRRRERRFETIAPQSISQNPSQPLLSALGGRPASSGQPVTETIAQGLPTVFACDLVIKQDVAKTPIKLKRRLKDGTRQDDVNHPVYIALHDMPNRAMTPYEFKETMQHSLNLWGNAYAEIVRHTTSVNGLALELWPLDPWRMTVKLDSLNRLVYSYARPSGGPKEWIYDPVNPPIFHLRQHTRGGFCGRSPIQVLRESMGVALARQQYQGRFYGQGGHAQVILSTENKLDEKAVRRIREDFETLTAGQENWHRPVVVDHGLKVEPFNMPHRDAQFVDQIKLTRSELAGAFRVYAQKINDLERATFSNITELNIAHVGDCLMPQFVCWQDAIARDLLNSKSFSTHFATFIVDALVRGDFKGFNEGLAIQRANGIITANQWRKAADMDDQISEEDGGDLYLVNGGMMPLRRDPAAAIDFPAPGGVN